MSVEHSMYKHLNHRKATLMHHNEDSISGSFSEGPGPKELTRNTIHMLAAVFTETLVSNLLSKHRNQVLWERGLSAWREDSQEAQEQDPSAG